jgi:hypothetical protein
VSLQLTHEADRAVEVSRTGVTLLRYVYRSELAPEEVRKPYFHPLRTLAGRCVTGFRPHDHRWHHGLAMTFAELSGQNFWGGPTFTRAAMKYESLDNHGRIDHVRFDRFDAAAALPSLTHTCHWVNHEGQTWFEDQREVAVAGLDPGQGWWSLRLRFSLRNVSDRTLTLGSPTTQGRPDAGYGSLFWRGPRDWTGGRIRLANGVDGPQAMGCSARWLAFTSRFDGEGDDTGTLVFVDHPDNPRHPTKWFVRNTPYACASCSFMFDQEYPIEPGDALMLRYHLLIADGDWDAAQVNRWADANVSA